MKLKPDEIVAKTVGDRLYVAVGSVVNDWAVYYGPAGSRPSVIAKRGGKILERDARLLFPEIEGNYRQAYWTKESFNG